MSNTAKVIVSIMSFDYPINSSKDVKKLFCSYGTVDNWLSDDETVSAMFNKLTNYVALFNFCYTEIFNNGNMYTCICWNFSSSSFLRKKEQKNNIILCSNSNLLELTRVQDQNMQRTSSGEQHLASNFLYETLKLRTNQCLDSHGLHLIWR
ncbi:hypothetical protein ACOSQ3_001510 [Xanthoceras sorbifolium]